MTREANPGAPGFRVAQDFASLKIGGFGWLAGVFGGFCKIFG